MFELLKVLHVLGWSAWFGLAVAEAITGVAVRKSADPTVRRALAATWARVGKVLQLTMFAAVIFGLATFVKEALMRAGGFAEFMRDKDMVFVHVMLTLGLLAGILTLLASQARGKAVAAIAGDGDAGFLSAYKRASMFSGMATLLILATVLEVYLRTAL